MKPAAAPYIRTTATTRSAARAVTVAEAVLNSPVLSQLAERINASGKRFKDIEALLPHALRNAVKPGPLDEACWCLLVDGNAAAAKVRQLTPLIKERLRDKGWKETAIRLRIVMPGKPSGRSSA